MCRHTLFSEAIIDRPVFFSEDDYLFYKALLAEGLKRYGGELHAYCLMTNHVHWLVTPDYLDSINSILSCPLPLGEGGVRE